ncbi:MULTISPECIES: YfgM family protein [Aliagarivorans]|uniref:YfgM family protein n=1 Tax=Aliagarivorans TaxID=882379 RepID=UPI000415174F|nr:MULTISPECIES: tetratricopeptide repeat protein [Aliagarivorans]
MEVYSTEEQQVQAIKDWWKKNGNSVVIGTVAGLALVFGWRYYGEHKVAQQEAASDAYQMVVEQMRRSGDAAPLQEYVLANQSGDNYEVFASLLLAKSLVDEGNYSDALQQLVYAQDNAPEELKGLVGLRVARVQFQLEDFDAALASLAQISDFSLQPLVDVLRGDVYIARGEKALARQAYQAALAAGGAELDASLNIKLNDLTEAPADNG